MSATVDSLSLAARRRPASEAIQIVERNLEGIIETASQFRGSARRRPQRSVIQLRALCYLCKDQLQSNTPTEPLASNRGYD